MFPKSCGKASDAGRVVANSFPDSNRERNRTVTKGSECQNGILTQRAVALNAPKFHLGAPVKIALNKNFGLVSTVFRGKAYRPGNLAGK